VGPFFSLAHSYSEHEMRENREKRKEEEEKNWRKEQEK
jgi:hypothetical protein